ncbi:MAG: PQQ-binding-like beta-propeller repeat protein [Vicingaceae bacterium]|nr:PQQ-binding-like beta-propeller repeat protein [Vicingaceae bacterium]
MKKLLLLAGVFMTLLTFAQDDMSMVWENKLEHKIESHGTGTEDRGYSYAASQKEISVFDNKTGKVLWIKRFKDVAPKLRKVDEIIALWESDAILLFDKKVGKDQVACIDIKTGNLLWNSERFQLSASFASAFVGSQNETTTFSDLFVDIPEENGFIVALKKEMIFVDAKTGKERWSTEKFKGVVGAYIYQEGFIYGINFVPGGLGALFTGMKNQVVKMDMSNGDVVWEQAYIGRAERKVITREFLFELDLKDDMLVLRMNGIQTYDIKTGAKLWAAAFDFTADKIVGKPAGTQKFGVYGAVAEPVFHGDDVYVLDMSSKKSQYLKKYDKNTGKLLWTSAEIKEARAIPSMGISGDKVVLQIGGVVEAQAFIRKKVKQGDTYTWVTERKVWYPEVKRFGLQAFNTSDGSLAWDSERFKKGISNSFTIDGNVVVSSGKALYSIAAADGNVNYEIALKDDGIGTGEGLRLYNDKSVIIGKKGISTHNISDGKLVASNKYKKSFIEDYKGDYLIMKTDGADIACFDLKDCSFKQFKAKKGSSSVLSTKAEFVYIYENKVVTKLKVK